MFFINTLSGRQLTGMKKILFCHAISAVSILTKHVIITHWEQMFSFLVIFHVILLMWQTSFARQTPFKIPWKSWKRRWKHCKIRWWILCHSTALFDHQLNDDFQPRFSFLKIEIKGCCRELMWFPWNWLSRNRNFLKIRDLIVDTFDSCKY